MGGARRGLGAALVVGIGVLLLGVSYVVVALFASIAGPPVPSRDSLPAVPAGFTVDAPESGCGSGGCFLVAKVHAPSTMSADQVVDALRGTVTDCRANGWFDRRTLCTGVELTGRDEVRITAMLHDLGK